MAEDFEDAGQRYLFLLRPVKDLGKNFEINIAKELDEYCSWLGNLTANEEFGVDNRHRFNFAEAAMLIHGSAFVFGKKVDYVHSQAIHFFEAMLPQKSKKKRKKGEDDEGFVDDNETSIDPCDLLDYRSVKPCNITSLYKVRERSKYKGKPPKIRIMPMSLMPLADNEKSGALIYSTGYRKEIVGRMDDFRMNSGFLNSRGVLLLHLCHEKIVNDFASEAFVRLWHPHLFPPNNTEPETLHQEGREQNLQSQALDSGRRFSQDGTADNGTGRASSVVEMSRRVTSNTFNNAHSARPSTRLMDVVEMETERLELVAEGDFGCCDDEFQGSESLNLPTPATNPFIRQPQPRVSPWHVSMLESETVDSDTEKLLLDPFEVVHWKVRPVDTIKRFVRSTVVAARIEKAENKSATFQKRTMQTNDYVREHFYMRKKHKTTKADDWQADALYRFVTAVTKKRANLKRERVKVKTKPLSEVNCNENQDDGGVFDDDENDDDDVEFADIDPGDIENVPPKSGEEGSAQNAKDATGLRRTTAIDALMFGDISDDDLNNSLDIDSLYGGCLPVGETQPIDDKQKEAYTLLEMLHQHMLKFWSTTEEISSELFIRVQEWEDTMLPILEEEETRKEFDIHEYGDELLNMFNEVGEEKTLNELLAGRKRYEISRYFLACLMMANTYNVRVTDDVRVDDKGNRSSVMKVTLLKKDRHHEVFDKAGAL